MSASTYSAQFTSQHNKQQFGGYLKIFPQKAASRCLMTLSVEILCQIKHDRKRITFYVFEETTSICLEVCYLNANKSGKVASE